jgi:hypothetical protein
MSTEPFARRRMAGGCGGLVLKTMTSHDLKRAGIRPGQLAQVIGVHPSTISDMLSGKTLRATPGACAIVFLWPTLTESQRASLLCGTHWLGGLPADQSSSP